MTPAPPDHEDVACIAHVHSTFSDGGATVPEIAATAAHSGADVVLLTDHDTIDARRQGYERWFDSVLMLIGHEVSPRGGHLLVFGVDREVGHAGRSEEEIIAAAIADGGVVFAAHPFSAGSRMSRRIGRPHPWTELEQERLGIELWSFQTDEAERWRTPAEAIRFLRRPDRRLSGPPPEHLEAWDRLCAHRRVPAIGGLDAHDKALRVRGRKLRPTPNDRYFRLLRTRVLLDRPLGSDVGDAATAVYAALGEGRCYLAVEAFESAAGFRFWAEGEEGPLAMGAESWSGGWTLHARTPRACELRLLREGMEVLAVHGDEFDHRADGPGVYRVEAHLEVAGRTRPWIVSNPIYLRGPDLGPAPH